MESYMSNNIDSYSFISTPYSTGTSSSSSSTSSAESSPRSLTPTPAPAAANVLSQNYEFKGQFFGEERIERVPAISGLVEILEKKKAYLEELGEDTTAIDVTLRSCQEALNGRSHIPPHVKERIARLEENRAENNRTLEAYIEKGAAVPQAVIRSIQTTNEQLIEIQEQLKFDWIGSNYFRDCLTDCEAMKDPDERVALEAYEKLIKSIIPAPVNLRRHEAITSDGNKTTMVRVGVISDMRNGYFSLHELNRMLKSKDWHTRTYRELDKRIQSVEKKIGGRSTPELVVLKYAAKQLQAENLKEVIKERASFLENQMLMVVLEHIRTAKESNPNFEQEHILPIMHLCLLNQKTNSVDETGWKKNEETFMDDMKGMFKLFKDKKLVFDGKGPFIDNDGDIHLPAEFGIRQFPMYLETFFSNVSIQGNTENKGKQAVINHDFFRDLKTHFNGRLPEEFEVLQEELRLGKQDPAIIAEELAAVAVRNGIYLSVGCLSAKDRTGLVCGRVSANCALENAALTEKEARKAEKIWSENILDGPNLEVCKECNIRCLEPKNVLGLKLIARDLPGIGKAKRAAHIVKLGQMQVQPNSDKAQEEKICSPRVHRRGGLTGHLSRILSRKQDSNDVFSIPTLRAASSTGRVKEVMPTINSSRSLSSVVEQMLENQEVAPVSIEKENDINSRIDSDSSCSSAAPTAPRPSITAGSNVKAKVAFFREWQSLQVNPQVRDSSVVGVQTPIALGSVENKRALFSQPR
jgi:hypothetical protein